MREFLEWIDRQIESESKDFVEGDRYTTGYLDALKQMKGEIEGRACAVTPVWLNSIKQFVGLDHFTLPTPRDKSSG